MRMLLQIVFVMLFAMPLAAPWAVAAERPNVVLFLVDDMGWMDCGAYGSQYYQTPHIDAFSRRAMRFTDAYAHPLCSPTRASILTGKHPTRHGILTASGHQPPQPVGHQFMPEAAPSNRAMISPESKNYLDRSEYTLAEALRDAGYRTSHNGKWHLGLTEEYRPEHYGFDVTFHCAPDPGPPGGYFSPYGVSASGDASGRNRVGNITDGPPGEYIVDRQADEAVRFMADSREQGKPFLLNLWCYGVHGPWGHKPEYTAEFAQRNDPRGVQGNPIMASMFRSVDECFGRILAELDRLGIADDTIVIFYSDNGGNVHSNIAGTAKTQAAQRRENATLADWRKWVGNRPPTNNAPLRDGKSSLYEGGTRVPMMWAWGERIAAEVNETVVGHIDIYPTLLELLDLPQPSQQKFDGVSLAPVLQSRGRLQREAFFNYFPYRPHEGGVTVRSGDFKLIRWFDPAFSRELYNLRQDVGEAENLAERMPDKVRRFDAMIDRFLEETGALVPQPNPAYRSAESSGSTSPARSLRGLVPKNCTVEIREEAMMVSGQGNAPFLGLTRLNHAGPVTMNVRTRGRGGRGKVQWRTTDQSSFPEEGQVVEFLLPDSGSGQETVIELPVYGTLLHLRLYLPAERSPVLIEQIELKPAAGVAQLWTFAD
jgi:arylsulfatase A-like enzyme